MKHKSVRLQNTFLLGMALLATFIILWTIQFVLYFMHMYTPGLSDALSTWTPLLLWIVAVLLGFGFAAQVLRRGAGEFLVPYLLALLLWCVYFFYCYTQQSAYMSFAFDVIGYGPGIPATQGTQLSFALLDPLVSLDTAVYVGIALFAGLAFVCIRKLINHARGQIKQ